MVDSRTRLHISPFDPDLVTSIIPPSLLPSASNISYHSIQTSPENSYGYVDLPTMEAEKLKKRLNRSILRGKKIRVENARPKKPAITADEPAEERSEALAEAAPIKTKKPKPKNGVLPGYELPEHRRVKRGWTDHTIKNARAKRRKNDLKSQPSKYSEKDELLFRTKVPSAQDSGKGKREKDKRVNIVHEFSNTTKHPSFLRNTGDGKNGRVTKKYDDEKNWVAEDGSVIEPKISTADNLPMFSGEDYSSDIEDVDAASGDEDSDPTSSEGSSDETRQEPNSGSKADAKSSKESEENAENPDTPNDSPEKSTQSASHSKPALEKSPLEALFKRPKSMTGIKPSLEVDTAFSFFDPNEDEVNPPSTPFTIHDGRERKLRSAAPTPDTPAPGKINFSARQLRSRLAGQVNDSDYFKGSRDTRSPSSQDSNAMPAGGKGEKEESEFSKWFWEHRGETNRAWKKRRREAAKEERQRENRRRSGRA